MLLQDYQNYHQIIKMFKFVICLFTPPTSSLTILLQTHSAVSHSFVVDAQFPATVTCKWPQSYCPLFETHTHVLYFKYPLNYPLCIAQITPIRAPVIVVARCLLLCLLLPAVWNTFWWKMWSKLFICGGWSGSVIAEIVVVNTAGSPCSPWLRFLKRSLFGVSSYKQGFVFVLFFIFQLRSGKSVTHAVGPTAKLQQQPWSHSNLQA